MSHTITAKEQTLAKIFSDDYVFTIPGYQRPYAWGREHAEELLEDLTAALDGAPIALADAAPYFLGSIVLIKSESSPEALVVDGQQRLTTLTLLMSAIRTVIKNNDVQLGITKRIYEHGDVVSATEATYRLSLREMDRAFFRESIQHEGGMQALLASSVDLPDAQARIRDNARLFVDALANVSEDQLTRLVQFMITRCYLVIVSTPDLDSAYRIFGVMNSRGLDLSATDILKAEIIGGIDKSLRDTYTKKWEETEEELGRNGFVELFSHIRMIYRKAKPHGTLLKEFKEHVEPAGRPREFIENVLLPMSSAFAEIISADYASRRNGEAVNDHLSWLNRLEFKDWIPPAIAFFVLRRNDPSAVLSFVRDLERLSYSMLARKAGVNERIERFSSLTLAIEAGHDLSVSSSPLQISPEEQHETYERLAGPVYDTYSARTMALLLLRLDRLLSDGTATYQHEVISVEHVMPQHPAPNSQWKGWIQDDAQHLNWVHRLANLALLSRRKNSSAGNRELLWKKEAYFTKGGVTSFALTSQVLQHDEWTIDVLEERQDALMTALESHWRLEGRMAKADIDAALLASVGAAGSEVIFELKSPRHGLVALARPEGNSMTVLAGSQARLIWTSRPHPYEQLRVALADSGVVRTSDDQSRFVFSTEYKFDSPSAASAAVLGRNDNGRSTWKVKGTSITYSAWAANQPR
jgi:hypothetical protein